MRTEHLAGLTLHTAIPRPPLSEFVARFWLSERATPLALKERALPTGTIEMVFNLRDDRLLVQGRQPSDRSPPLPGAVLCGPHSEYFVIDSVPDDVILGVHFKPGGAAPFLPVAAGELRNGLVALDAVLGALATRLRPRLMDAATPVARFRLLEDFLLASARRPLALAPPVAFALAAFQGVPLTRSVAAVAEQVGLSHRRFIQVFQDTVGLTPKQYCRVRRFQAVVRLVEQRRPIAWADIALHCGYFDQAHCIHDFRAFAGLTPTAYLRQRGERANHPSDPA